MTSEIRRDRVGMLRYYVHGRLFEWSMTIPMLLLAVTTFFYPRTLEASAFQWIVVAMPIPLVEAMLFLIGWTALIGLMLNGHRIGEFKIGAIIRAIAAVGRAVMWSQFSLALIRLSIIEGFLSPGVYFWTTFMVTETYVAFATAATLRRK